MDDEENKSVINRRGIPAARSNLWVARIAASKYLSEKAKAEPDKYELMLYYGSFFVFARSALYALKSSDGTLSPHLHLTQEEYAASKILRDPIFQMLTGERNRIGHGDDSWGLHPMNTLGMIERFKESGHDWSVAVFDEVWPDAPFRGERIEDVMSKVWRAVSNWLDDINVLDQQAHESDSSSDVED